MNEVNAAIITIGDELLIGQTIDTNSAFIAQELNKTGIWVKRRIAIGDVREDILNALREQSRDCNLIIITGGLGPTADDITKPTLCEYFGGKLVLHQPTLEHVTYLFEHVFRRPMPLLERNRRQAEVPDVCTVLKNERGTAPGMWFEKDNVFFVSLPGVPHEMKGLMLDSVIPKLKKTFKLPVVLHRNLLTSGIGESLLADHIADFENDLPSHIKLAYLPAYGMVRLRLTSRGSDKNSVENELDNLFIQLKSFVKKLMVTDEDISLPKAVLNLLQSKKKTVSTAESCTGGNIAHLITSIPGSSASYNGSVVSYANDAKENLLGVKRETLLQFGAVSEQTVVEMVNGALKELKTDYAIATSGIMGPDGGTPEKPVGTVWIAVGNNKKIIALQHSFRFDRERNIELTTHNALSMLYRFVKEEEGE
jgi:nicotinamide-nucleotide amidase